MSIPSFFHWLTTTRYTRKLESDLLSLRAEVCQLRLHNDELLRALSPALRTVIPSNSLQQLGSGSLTDAAPTSPKLSELPLRAKRRSMSDVRKELEARNNPEPGFEHRVAANTQALTLSTMAIPFK